MVAIERDAPRADYKPEVQKSVITTDPDLDWFNKVKEENNKKNASGGFNLRGFIGTSALYMGGTFALFGIAAFCINFFSGSASADDGTDPKVKSQITTQQKAVIQSREFSKVLYNCNPDKKYDGGVLGLGKVLVYDFDDCWDRMVKFHDLMKSYESVIDSNLGPDTASDKTLADVLKEAKASAAKLPPPE